MIETNIQKEQTNSGRLSKDFDNINKCYQEYCELRQDGLDLSKKESKILENVWIMLSKTKHHNMISKKTVEICESVKRCLQNYEKYEKKESVPFSQYLWHDLSCFALRQMYDEISNESNYQINPISMTPYIKRKLLKLKRVINVFTMNKGNKPDFNIKADRVWICKQINCSNKQLSDYLAILNRNIVSTETSTGEDESLKLGDLLPSQLLNPQEIYECINNLKEHFAIFQEQWLTVNKSEMRENISSLITWFVLSECGNIEEDVIKPIMSEYDIFDKVMIDKYFSGFYKDSFLQSDIAKELGLANDYANKILHERFLKKIQEKHQKGELG